jgi:hypothetical protein
MGEATGGQLLAANFFDAFAPNANPMQTTI